MAELRFSKAFDSLQLYWLCSLAVLSLVLAIGENNNAAIARVRQSLNYPLMPLFWLREQSLEQYHTLSNWRERHSYLKQLEQQHEQLKIAHAQRQQEQQQLELENAQLRQLTDLADATQLAAIYAQILRLDQLLLDLSIVVNKGSTSGVQENSIVLSRAGVVGQVASVGPNIAQIIPITSSRHRLPVRLGSDQGYYNARGVGDGRHLSVDKVRQDAELSVGDGVYTSGLGKRFAAGLLVGSISAINPISNETFSEVIIEAASATEQTRFVVILQAD